MIPEFTHTTNKTDYYLNVFEESLNAYMELPEIKALSARDIIRVRDEIANWFDIICDDYMDTNETGKYRMVHEYPDLTIRATIIMMSS